MGQQVRQVVIVGASAAGLRCASRLRRLQPEWKIQVVEQRPVFSYAACGLPYVLSGDINDARKLRATGDGTLRDVSYFAGVKGVEVLGECRAVSVDAGRRHLAIEDATGRRELPYDDLVLATGARARRLPGQPEHPRVRAFHTLDDLVALQEGLSRGRYRRIIIVGAGLVGIEVAEALVALWGAEVVMLESGAHPLPGILDAECGAVVERILAQHGVDLRCRAAVENIEAREDGTTVTAASGQIQADLVIVAVGLEPASGLARQAGIALGSNGAILVDEHLRTGLPHVWAAGDCIEVEHALDGKGCYLPLGSLANRQGRTLANVLAGIPDRFPAVAGSIALKIFDHHLAAVGFNRTSALTRGLNVRSVWTAPPDRADYWPDSKDFALQLSYEPSSHRLLGVQAVGTGEVAKRIDTATQLICRGGTIEDVAQLEHAYAPPYAPALDPLAVAGSVALNQEGGLDSLSPLTPLQGLRLLDVRSPGERETRPVKADRVLSIPLPELRKSLSRVEPGEWVAVCARGARSAEAARILQSAGFRASFLGGGTRFQALMGRS